MLISYDVYKPIHTDNSPPIIEKITICLGFSDKFLAIAAGIINIPVINNNPTIFIEIAISAASKIVNIALTLSGFIPSASASSWLTVDANKGFQIKHKTKSISAPPIQMIKRSFTFTDKISPNKTPIISNLINDKNPNTTKPIAREECDSKPNNASPARYVEFSNFNKIKDTIEATINTEKAIFISNEIDNKTPSKEECASVSPKNDSRLQTTKHPRGPVTNAIPIPAINALNKKSSNIFIIFLPLYYHRMNEHDCAHVHKWIIVEMIVHQIILYNFYFLQHPQEILNNIHDHLNRQHDQ